MAEGTGIEWCHHSLNLWWGCTKVSAGCTNCYADTLAHRFGKNNWGPKGEREEKGWRATLNKISKAAAEDPGQRHRVFCQSMADTFEDATTCGGETSRNWATIQRLRIELFAQIVMHPELDFLVLTKRPEHAARLLGSIEFWDAVNAELRRLGQPGIPYCTDDYAQGDVLLPNLWLGASVENQEQADKRIPELLKVPATVRFLSCEPLLGPVNLHQTQGENACTCGIPSLDGAGMHSPRCPIFDFPKGIHWVIAGGESGTRARPMPPAAVESLRKQCADAGVPFFFKQWGEWAPCTASAKAKADALGLHVRYHAWGDGLYSFRCGKNSAGRLLGGLEYSELPQVVPHV